MTREWSQNSAQLRKALGFGTEAQLHANMYMYVCACVYKCVCTCECVCMHV